MKTRLLLRMVRSSIGATVALALLVAVASAIFTAWPRLERQTFTDEVNYAIAETPPTLRALTATLPDPPVRDEAGLAELESVLAQTFTGAGEHMTRTTGDPRVSVTTTRVSMSAADRGSDDFFETSVRFRVDRGISSLVEMVEGTAPGPPAEASDGGALAPVEVMLAAGTAERMELGLGERFTAPVTTNSYAAGSSTRSEFVVVGVFEATNPAADQWQHQLNTLTPRIDSDFNRGDAATATVYIDPASLAWMARSAEAEIWVPVRAEAEGAAGLLADLRAFTAVEHPLELSGPSDPPQVRFDTGLTEVLHSAIGRWRSTSTVLAMVAAGPIGVTFAVLALGARLALTRRAASLALAAARGGSGRQLRSLLAVEGLAFGIPAAVLGAAVAILAVPVPGAAPAPTNLLLPAATALAPAVLLAAMPLPRLRPSRDDVAIRSRSRWRWVVEVAVLLITAASLWLVTGQGVTGAGGGTDPLAVTAPLLLAISVSLLTLRLFPLVVHVVHGAARRGRGLTAFLGSARLLRSGATPLIPVLALATGVAIAVLAATMLTTLRGGVDDGARADAGADVRLNGPTFSEGDLTEIAGLDGVAAVSAVTTIPAVALAEDDTSRRVTVYAVDSATLPEVQTDVPGAVTVPGGFSELSPTGVPALVWSGHEVDTSEEVRLVLDSSVVLDVVGEPAAAPGVVGPGAWVIVDLQLVREATGQNLVPRDVLVDLDDGAGPDAVRALSEWMAGRGTIVSPAESTAEFLASPSARSLQAGFVIALVVSLVLACLAIILGLLLAAPERRRLLGVLRTLGVSRAMAGRLVAWESVPLVVAALVVGTGLGLVLPYLVAGTVDLRPFTGADTAPELRSDPLLITGVVAALAVVLTVCVLLAGVIARRLSTSVLRIGES
ncbi:FtsX-like permease family protein [Ruania alba]|uniref:Putative ABC transport system permease protein n=1 Tax=Ruania alba TaxID=648782 RepID=A0A1H5HTB1_9MICO|nr:FtsX-like permease family protein [Ruania alba]SEE31203.1 putative ABC transport system permease protein [Ruania alba]